MKTKVVYIVAALALAVPLLSLNVALADPGDIGGVIERLEVDTVGHQPSMTHVSGDVYAIAYKSSSGDLTTVEISAAGAIGAVLDTQGLTNDGDKGDWPSIVRVSDYVVAVAFKGTDDNGWLETWGINADGIISGTALGSLKFASTGDHPSMTHVSGDVYAIAYKSSSGDLTTVEIATNGSITELDTQGLTNDGDKGDQPSIVRVSDDVVAVAFKGDPDDVEVNEGWLETWGIDADGIISGTALGSLKFASECHHPSMTHVSGDVYAIAYRSSSGYLTTVEIATNGSITELDTQGLTHDGTKGDQSSIVRVSDDVVAVAFKGDPDDVKVDEGWLETWGIDADGIISGTALGSLKFAGTGDQPSMTHVSGDVYAIAYKSDSVHLVTVGITTPTPPPSGDGCFIATAAYGTESAEEIDVLRAFRDEVLLENALGSQLVEWYYQTSPPVADFISENDVLKTLVRELVIDPIVSVATFTQGIWGD